MFFKHIPKPLVVPTAMNTIFNFLVFMIVPLLAIYFKAHGVSEQWLGIVFSFFPLVMIFFAPVVGILSDHIGRKRIIRIGILSQLIALALYIWTPSISMIILARIFAGIGWASVTLITLAKVEDKVAESERGSKTGFFLSISYIGMILGPLVGSFLAELVSIRFSFIISFFGIAILLLWLFLWKSHHKPVIKKKDFNPIKTIKLFLSEKKLRAMAFLGMAMHMRAPIFKIFLPLLIVFELGLGYKEVGFVLFIQGLTHVLQGFAGKITDKKGSANVLIISVIISSVIFMMIGFTKVYALILILFFLEGLAGAFWNVSAWTFMSEIGERRGMEGVVVGSYTSLAKIGHFVFAMVSGFIAVALGISSLFVIAGIASLIVVISIAPVLKAKTETI